MTELTSLQIGHKALSYISLLAQHCHKLTNIVVYGDQYSVTDILSLCRANALLKELYFYYPVNLSDTLLIDLIHSCPHIHTLRLTYETDITDVGILILSEHCPQLQYLDICDGFKITETAILQLLQRCHKLIKLVVSISSLSEETLTQLDKNTQKRVRRW